MKTPHLDLLKQKMKKFCGEHTEPIKIIHVKCEIRDYVPAYPLTNNLKFFDCHICGAQQKKIFRLNLKSIEAAKDRWNRFENTFETRTHVIYLCKFHFETNFSSFKKMIEDSANGNYESYSYYKN